MQFEAKEINLNDLIPVGTWGVGAIHGETPQGPASYVVVAPQAESEDEQLPQLVMTAELAEQLIEMLRVQIKMIRSGDPFGGASPTPVK